MAVELINGRTPEDLKDALMRCGRRHCKAESGDCPYYIDCLVGATRLKLMKDAFDYIRYLESDRDAALAKVPKWISVEERLPENDDLVLVRANGRTRETRWEGAYVLAMYGLDGWVLWDYEDDEVQHLRVLHWMPLPEPPEEEKHETTD